MKPQKLSLTTHSRGDKLYVTLGRTENALCYDVAVFDRATGLWQTFPSARTRPVRLGGIEDWRVIGNRLFVCGKDWDGTSPATAWMDVLDLDDMSWTHGTTNTWAAHLRTIGPMCISADGGHAVIAGRDGTQGNGSMERITLVSTAATPGGVLPLIGGNANYVPTGVIAAHGQHILCLPDGRVMRSATLAGWQPIAVPDVGQGAMRPIRGGNRDLLVFETAAAVPFLFSMGGDMAISAQGIERAAVAGMAAAGAGRCYFMLAAQNGVQVPSLNWRVLNVDDGSIAALADAPEVLHCFSLCATADGVFAIRGNTAYFGYLGEVTRGVVVGRAFSQLSVSASGTLYLVSESEVVTVKQGAWHECADDYLICVAGDAQIFGQIANI